MKFINITSIRDHLYTLCDDGCIYWVDDKNIWHKIDPPEEEEKNEKENSPSNTIVNGN